MKSNPKKEIVTSAVAAVCAIALIGTTAGLYYWNQPVAPDQYAKVNTVFFKDFDSAQQIAMMQMTAVDADGNPQSFELEKQNGLWTIPTHHDYPAEAGQRLSETATALQGLVRSRLANAAKGAQDKLGVLDPTSEEAKENPEGAGKLIQFRDSNDEILFNLIVGKKVDKQENASVYDLRENEVETNDYYVRVPTENETYVAELTLDISTKFSDWINKDLLEVSTSQLRKLELENYRLESRNVINNGGISVQRQMVREGDLVLSKDSGAAPWILPDLKPDQEVDSAKVDEVLQAIENIELIGVRPQYTYQGQSLLDDSLELSLPESLQKDQQAAIQALEEMQDQLLSAGFGLAQDPRTGKARLVAEYGEMEATSNEGIIYTLLYGAEVKGEDAAIEIGDTEDSTAPDQTSLAIDEDSPETETDRANSEESDEPEGGRLVMIRVGFDPSMVEGMPTKPVAPQQLTLPENFDSENLEKIPNGTMQLPTFDAPPVPSSFSETNPNSQTPSEEINNAAADPAGSLPPQPEQPGSQAEDGGTAGLFNVQDEILEAATDETAVNDQDANVSAGQPTEPTPREEAQQQLDAQYQMQLQQFEQQKQLYEAELKDYQESVAQSKKKAERLKQRFANWYYVVPNSDLEALRMKREDVVKAKTQINESGQIQNPLGLPPGFDPSMLQGR